MHQDVAAGRNKHGYRQAGDRRSREHARVRGVRWSLLTCVATFASLVGATFVVSTSGAGAAERSSESSTPVEIGLPYPADLAGLPAILGGGSGSSGATFPSNQQTQAIYQSLVTYINDHGGLLGHQIKPVFFPEDVLTASGSATDQAMCTAFTQDNHVFAVMAPSAHGTTLISCLNAAHVILMDAAGASSLDAAMFKQYKDYATAGSLNLNNVAAVEVNGLFKEGFFGKDPKIGLIGYNSPAFTAAVSQSLKPALAKHGLKLTDQQLIDPVTGVADVASSQAAISNALLRFKGEGIDHVLFLDTEGATLHPWAIAETAQNYFPRLGFTTNEMPSERAYAGDTYDPQQAEQFQTGLAVGWDPGDDTPHASSNATGDKCNTIMEGAGASEAQASLFWGLCDQVLDFAAGVNAGGKLTPQAAMAGLAKAKNLPSAELLAPPNYSNGHTDGASVGRFLKYASSCQCFAYTGSSFPLSSLEGT